MNTSTAKRGSSAPGVIRAETECGLAGDHEADAGSDSWPPGSSEIIARSLGVFRLR